MDGVSLFKIGENDYTRFITVPSYKVNSKPVVKECNNIREVTYSQYVRDKISGSFTLKFFDDSSYEDVNTTKSAAENFKAFFADYNEHRTANGYIEITVYVQNLDTTKTIQAKMEMDPSDTMPYMSTSKSYDGFDVTITQK